MNIVHVCLNGPYTDNWGYQENIIPSYHKKFGHSVTVIAQNRKHLDNGEIVEVDCDDYYLDDGVKVIRISKQYKYFKKYTDVFSPYNIFDILCELKADFIMVHGLIGSISALQVNKYIKKKNNNCIAVADIHNEFYVSPFKNNIKGIILKLIHRLLNNKTFKYYKKIFYIAPSSEEYAREYHKVPSDMLELLPLGCNIELLQNKNSDLIRKQIRNKFYFSDNDIIICHGGKLNSAKKSLELTTAIKRLNKENDKIKMIIFGSFADEIKMEIENEIRENSSFIKYAGMLKTDEYYDIYLASDIAAFPGSQSSIWPEAIACGLALMVKRHYEVEYLDLGGNIGYFDNDSEDELFNKLNNIITNENYVNMKNVAKEKGAYYFSYERISRQVLKYT